MLRTCREPPARRRTVPLADFSAAAQPRCRASGRRRRHRQPPHHLDDRHRLQDPPAGRRDAARVLDVIYRRELGAKYNPAIVDTLYQVHCLVEKYFATEYAEDRKAIVKWIASSASSPTLVGRITRIRMDWPALEHGVYYVNERVGPHESHYFLGVPKGYDRTTPGRWSSCCRRRSPSSPNRRPMPTRSPRFTPTGSTRNSPSTPMRWC